MLSGSHVIIICLTSLVFSLAVSALQSNSDRWLAICRSRRSCQMSDGGPSLQQSRHSAGLSVIIVFSADWKFVHLSDCHFVRFSSLQTVTGPLSLGQEKKGRFQNSFQRLLKIARRPNVPASSPKLKFCSGHQVASLVVA